MNKKLTGQPFLRALLGLGAITAFFWLATKTETADLLRFTTPRNQILANAKQAFAESGLDQYDLQRSIRVEFEDELARYLQSRARAVGSAAFPPVGYWSISWRGKIKTSDGEAKTARFTAKYDLQGNFVGFLQQDPVNTPSESLTEAEALTEALVALHSFQVDTTELRPTKKTAADKEGTQSHRFSFSRSIPFSEDLKEDFAVEILGSQVVELTSTVRVDSGKFTFPEIENLSATIAQVLAGLTWVMICSFLLVTLFRRIRHDELEFNRALRFAIVIALLMWIQVGADNLDDLMGLFLGGGFAGLFTGLGILLAFTVTESLTREVTPEKLRTADLLFRGTMRVKEMGAAILNSFYVAGLPLLAFGLLMWLLGALDLGYLKFENEHFWVFEDTTETVKALCEHLVAASFMAVVPLLFWSSHLNTKFTNPTTQVILVGTMLVLSGLHFNYLRPAYFALPLVLPIGLLWAYSVRKYDFVTILLSFFWFQLLLNGGLAGLSTDSLLGPAGVATGVLLLGLAASGVALSFSERSTDDFRHYVPAYVSRIAERERMLKELEIARTVQMKFLPQQLPVFPKLDMACVCRPAMEVGGDYYDFLAIGEDHLSVLIGDVSGKGVSAAFYMTMTSGIVRTLSKRIESPKTILTELNEVFYEYTPKNVFISAIYGRFDMKNKTLTFARAGHNPVMGWKSVGAETKILNSRGMAIGLENGKLFSATIEEKTIPIEAGDLFVFYTDGISEAMNHNADEFGEQRLSELITAHAQAEAQSFLQQVTDEVNQFVGDTMQHDDLTMVVVKVK